MRVVMEVQRKFGQVPIEEIELDPRGRDDIPAVLRGLRSSLPGALRGGRFVDDRGFFTGGQDAVPVPDFVQYGYGVFIGTQPARIGANFGTGDHAEAGSFKSCGQGARINSGLRGGSSSASGRRIRDQQFEPARTGLGAYAW